MKASSDKYKTNTFTHTHPVWMCITDNIVCIELHFIPSYWIYTSQNVAYVSFPFRVCIYYFTASDSEDLLLFKRKRWLAKIMYIFTKTHIKFNAINMINSTKKIHLSPPAWKWLNNTLWTIASAKKMKLNKSKCNLQANRMKSSLW